jgi:uncharacterized membrane protein YidH (DUF202 family)
LRRRDAQGPSQKKKKKKKKKNHLTERTCRAQASSSESESQRQDLDQDQQSEEDQKYHPSNPWAFTFAWPLTSPLLIPNTNSDARDHLANERTFLSWLRLATYLAIVSVAVLINFHLRHQPSRLERHVSLPLGLVFWCLALTALVAGVAKYVRTVSRYAHGQALVQSGVKTQVLFGVVSTAIVAACVLFLGLDAMARSETR